MRAGMLSRLAPVYPVTLPTITGLLSLIIWTLLLIVTVKYLLFVLRADNQGEGGTWHSWPWGNVIGKSQRFP